MPLDANIPLRAISNLQMEGPLDTAQKAYTLLSLRDQMKQNELARQEAERKNRDDQTAREIFARGLKDDETVAELRKRGLVNLASEYEQGIIDRRYKISLMDTAQMNKHKTELQQLGNMATDLKGIPAGPQRDARWLAHRQVLLQSGIDPGQVPDQTPDDDMLSVFIAQNANTLDEFELEAKRREATKPQAFGSAFESGGQQTQGFLQYNPETKQWEIKTQSMGPVSPPVAAQTFEAQTYEDFKKDPELVKKYGDSRTGFEKWQSDLIQSRQVPQTIVVQTVDDEGKPVTRIVPKTPGSEFAAAPTADQRNKEAAKSLVDKSITAVKGLGDKIITNTNAFAQRVEAIKRSGEAALASDPEFRVYQDARMALAGNLAVRQQGSRPSDADIKAIWLPLVPDVFRDTKESAALKWDLINTMSGISSPQISAPTSGSAQEWERGPDGKLRPKK